mmetsp:Transcript_55933/g.121057  ORF Transcript_55933/g.121057 Transcript_55933/m.121057 type:complete len:827 (+) Transcript_55933:53-2533(+)
MEEDGVASLQGRRSGPSVTRSGEPTQRFSTLQQQLLCAAIHFFHRHIRSDPDVLQRMEGNHMFRLFFEVQYHNNKPDLNRIFPESVHDCSALHVTSFILSILHQGIFSVSAFIVSVIYLSRFKECSHITLHACTWRPLFLTSLLLADKMWEDKPVRNSSLAKLFPVLSNVELNRMESEFLGEIRFNVLVKPDLFCSFCEKLLAEQVHQEITKCVNQSEYAATLQSDQLDVALGKAPQGEQEVAENDANSQLNVNGSMEKAGSQHANGNLENNKSFTQPASMSLNSQMQPAEQQSNFDKHVDSAATKSRKEPENDRLRRVELSRRVAEQPPQVQAIRTPASGGTGAGSMKSSLTPQPPRSLSVHPLPRNESIKKHVLGKAEDVVPEKTSRPVPGHHPIPQHVQGGLSLRRSLPAKTSSLYAPLPRTQVGLQSATARPFGSAALGRQGSSVGGVRGFQRDGAATVAPSLGMSSSATGPSTGYHGTNASSEAGPGPASGSTSLRSVFAGHVGNSGGSVAESAGCSTSGQGPTSSGNSLAVVAARHVPQSSPRSPSGSTEQQHSVRATALSVSQSQVQGGQPGPRVQGPPMKLQPRSTISGQSSLGCSNQQTSCGLQPSRSSSAPRVTHGATLRTPSQPMQASGYPARHQVGHPYGQVPGHVPGSPSMNSPMANSVAAPSASQHYHQSVYPSSPATRAVSPAGVPMVSSGMPIHSGRGSLGGNVQRNPSPLGAACPASPTGSCPCGQMPFGAAPGGWNAGTMAQRQDLLSTTRGRSPPPTVVGHSGAGLRQPRAATPGGIVKGIAQGMHVGNTYRNSLGPHMVVHRGGLM